MKQAIFKRNIVLIFFTMVKIKIEQVPLPCGASPELGSKVPQVLPLVAFAPSA